MRRVFTSVLALLLITCLYPADVQAYNGRAKVTKESEQELGVKFDVTFQEHDELLLIKVTVPPKVKSMPLHSFAVIQIQQEKVSLRVPIVTSAWVSIIEGKELAPRNRTLRPSVVSFSVAPQNLSKTHLDVSYGSFDAGWTYVVDLSSYYSPAVGDELE